MSEEEKEKIEGIEEVSVETGENTENTENVESLEDLRNGEVEVVGTDTIEKTELNLRTLSEDRILDAGISNEMKRSYIDYAMSVIVSRALPSVEDGLKPVHRRILYAMKLMGLEKGMTKKSARIVGDTMGKFHPHGDAAIYGAMVRMAQSFSLRYPLVQGQGNFGSMDGDNPAAPRYTEAKLAKISLELLQDIDKETVKLLSTFDNSSKEPVVLPGKLPNLLINGSSGIAVGMTTNIPPHNLNEVCDAIIKTIDNPKITFEELMEIIPGPDLPTGGKIVSENLKELYQNGRASFIIRGKTSIEEKNGRELIVITEIPYQVNKADLVKSIAILVGEKKLLDVADIRDESSKGKVRIVVELKKGANAQFTINRLFQSTKLQNRFDAVLVALEAGVPKTFSLKRFIESYIKHRRKMVRKRTEFDLRKAEAREHIVTGLLIALANLDEVIRIIKKSKNALEANESLQVKFKLTKKQAEAVLELTLRQLTSLEHEKLKNEIGRASCRERV